jgi:peptide-methionine (R)-S-oxide reductase
MLHKSLVVSILLSMAHAFSVLPTVRRNVFLSAKVLKTEEEWRLLLDQESFDVLRNAGTEQPFTSILNNIKSGDKGTFLCKGCKARLFPTVSKFESGTGWPSFAYPVDNFAIEYEVDFAAMVLRIECRCSTCGGHLGHVFEDGPQPTGLRYCMNGISMDFSDLDSSSREAMHVKLPWKVVFPGVLLNCGVSGLFLFNFMNHGMPPATASLLAQAVGALPLLIAAYYGYNATVGLLRSVDI